jgi:hypothetical protein
MYRFILSACLTLLPLLAGAAGYSDGLSAADAPPSYSAKQIIAFSKKVEKTLAAHGARVALVSRMGRPLSEMPEGMHYTHVGFAVYSEITTRDERKLPGYAMFNLYQDNAHPNRSALVQDYPVEFFAGAAVLESGILIPSPELQRRLLAVIGSPTYTSLHDPHYSAIANPYTLGKQNCTEFVLDVVNAAIYQTDSIRQIKASEKQYFTAQKVNVSPLKLMLGSIFSAEIATSDQPGTPETATFETIAAYLQKYDDGAQLLTILPDESE